MWLRIAALATVALAMLPCVARADDLESVRTMFGLSTFANAQERIENIGTLPTAGMQIPQPKGLTVLGSATGAYNGKVTSEVLYYEAAPGTVPDVVSYVQQLVASGWRAWGMVPTPNVFAYPGGVQTTFPQTFCGKGMPALVVRSERQYLVIRADTSSGMCTAMGVGNRPAPTISKAPYPVFVSPDGATFVGASKQTFNGTSHVAAIAVNSTADASSILARLAKQMTDAGWIVRTPAVANGDSQAFSIRDKDGVDWLAALTVVSIRNGQYVFTASAFKTTETKSTNVASSLAP